VRCFIAVPVPRDRLAWIDAVRVGLAGRADGVRWISAEALHVTIRFLGEVESERIPQVARRVGEAAAVSKRFTVRFGGVTVLPHPRRATALCVEIDDPEGGLARFHEEVGSRLAVDGFTREARSFRPHLTIGRWRTPPSPVGVDTLLRSAPVPSGEQWAIDDVRVMKSELTPRGAIYTILATVPLGMGLYSDSSPTIRGATS